MQPEARKYLDDIQQTIEELESFVGGKTYKEYESDAMMRAAVERKFEIIGEALSQLLHLEPTIASRISEYRRIITFRNILIHGYSQVDDRIVWDIVETRLSTLRKEVAQLLQE